MEDTIKRLTQSVNVLTALEEEFHSFTQLYKQREQDKMVFDERLETQQKAAKHAAEEAVKTVRQDAERSKKNLKWWIITAIGLLTLLLTYLQFEYNTHHALFNSSSEVQDADYTIK